MLRIAGKGYEGMHRCSIAVLALFGCGGPTATAPPRPSEAVPKVGLVACPAGTTALTGIVVDEHGAKVHSFGVVATMTFAFTGVYQKPARITSRDGTFRTCVPARNTIDVVIVGPEFARTTIPGVPALGPEAPLGTVVVKPGIPVTGVVQTGDGAVVRDATVRIVQSPWADDLFTNLSIGNLETHTDEHGNFSFETYRKLPLGNPARIFASTTDSGVSPQYWIRDGAGPMTLTIAPAGGIDAIVSGAQDGDIVMIASRSGGVFDAKLRAGHATFQGLPAGDYTVSLLPVRSVIQAAGSNESRDAILESFRPTQLGTVNVAAGTLGSVSLTYSGATPARP